MMVKELLSGKEIFEQGWKEMREQVRGLTMKGVPRS